MIRKSPHLNGILSHEDEQLAAALAARCAHQLHKIYRAYVIKTTQPRQPGMPASPAHNSLGTSSRHPAAVQKFKLGVEQQQGSSAQPIITNGVDSRRLLLRFVSVLFQSAPSGGWRPLTPCTQIYQFS
jgi:hypothetical protein